MSIPFGEFKSTLWLWNNGTQPASRHFFTLPKELSQNIRNTIDTSIKNPGGMIKIEARISRYSRTTSIFRDKKTGTYLLPVKAQVRKDLNLKAQDEVTIEIRIL